MEIREEENEEEKEKTIHFDGLEMKLEFKLKMLKNFIGINYSQS